ncbi:hypothetical protein KR018_011472 [Drosophila ironensis]|nr:hypothetical protein KR018_011472 [Drosophila ironensis]
MDRRKNAKSGKKPGPGPAPAKKAANPTSEESSASPAFDGNSDNAIQFEMELCWCVQQLQNALLTGKLSQRAGEDTTKNLKILTSRTAPIIKKRQVMKLSMGDYRTKMQQEEKKMKLAANQIKFTASTEQKSSFVKKSSLSEDKKNIRPETVESNSEQGLSKGSLKLEGAGNAFKFNFAVEEDPSDLNFNNLKINS